LGFTLDPYSGGFIQTVGFDQGEGYFPVQRGVVGQVDHFFATLPQEPFDLVPAIGE